MSIGVDQRHFTFLIHLLIEWAYQNGYELTFGDAFRDKRVHGDYGVKMGYGHPRSYHKRRLAVDFNLFVDGHYIQDGELYRPLGEYWESLDVKCSWGGRFGEKMENGKLKVGWDANHFSYGESRD